MEQPSPPRRGLTVNPVAALPARRAGTKEGVCSIVMGIPLDLGNICGPQSPTANRQHSATAPTTPVRGDDLPAVMMANGRRYFGCSHTGGRFRESSPYVCETMNPLAWEV